MGFHLTQSYNALAPYSAPLLSEKKFSNGRCQAQVPCDDQGSLIKLGFGVDVMMG
jgi:hypothetical protein